MIQRIHSIFLLLAAAAALGLFGLPLAATSEPVTNSVLFADAQYQLEDHWSLMASFGLAGLFLLGAIFLFRNRKMQMNLTLFGVLLSIIGAGVSAYFFFSDTGANEADPSGGIGLPIATIIFGLLAYTYINKDEKLVRSADRLR